MYTEHTLIDDFKLIKKVSNIIRDLSPEKKEQLIAHLEDWAKSDEKRVETRKEVTLQVDYSINDRFYSDSLGNLSSRGAFIKTPMTFDEGRQTTMIISLPHQERNIKMKGKIVRRTEEGVGIRFHQGQAEKNEQLRTSLNFL